MGVVRGSIPRESSVLFFYFSYLLFLWFYLPPFPFLFLYCFLSQLIASSGLSAYDRSTYIPEHNSDAIVQLFVCWVATRYISGKRDTINPWEHAFCTCAVPILFEIKKPENSKSKMSILQWNKQHHTLDTIDMSRKTVGKQGIPYLH